MLTRLLKSSFVLHTFTAIKTMKCARFDWLLMSGLFGRDDTYTRWCVFLSSVLRVHIHILLIRNIGWLNGELNGTVAHYNHHERKKIRIKNHLLQCVMGAWHFSTVVSVLHYGNLHIFDRNRDAFRESLDANCFWNRNHH